MKYSIKQDVVDTKGNRGTIVNASETRGDAFYQVLFDKDWSTGKADYVPEENLTPLHAQQQYDFDDKPDWAVNIDTLEDMSVLTKVMR